MRDPVSLAPSTISAAKIDAQAREMQLTAVDEILTHDNAGNSSLSPNMITLDPMKDYVNNFVAYIAEFGLPCALSLIWQRKTRRSMIHLHPPGVRFPLLCRGDSSDFAVLRQVIGKREVAFPLDKSPETIIDAGANVGFASVLFANLWPDAKIVAVEPDTNNFELLLANTAEYPQIRCIQGAIWPVEEELKILNPNDAAFEFRVSSAETEQGGVRGLTISEVQRLAGFDTVDLLKLDIEGAEADLFRDGRPAWLDHVETVAVELHDRFRPDCSKLVYDALANWRHTKRGEYDVFHRP